MAKDFKVGNFQLNTATGTQNVTGVGFQPKALVFFHQPSTVDIIGANIANWYHSVGMCNSDMTQYGMWTFQPNGNSGLESSIYAQNDTHAIYSGSNGSVYHYARVTSMDSDGFTIEVDQAPGVPYMVGYMALGGADLDVKVGLFNGTGTTGLQATTGLGFQPTGLLVYSIGQTVWSLVPDFTSASSYSTFGFSDGVNDRNSSYTLRDSSLGAFWSVKSQSNTSIIQQWSTNAPSTLQSEANVSSFDADGFTLNWTNNSGTTTKYMYLAVGNTNTTVGNYNTPNVTGVTKVVSGLTHETNALFLTSSNQNQYNYLEPYPGNDVGAGTMEGMATAPGEEFVQEATGTRLLPSTYWGWMQSSVLSQSRHAHNARATIYEQGSFDSFATDGFSINYPTYVLGGGARSVVSYFAIEGDGGTPPNGGENPSGGSGDPNSPDSIFLTTFIGV